MPFSGILAGLDDNDRFAMDCIDRVDYESKELGCNVVHSVLSSNCGKLDRTLERGGGAFKKRAGNVCGPIVS